MSRKTLLLLLTLFMFLNTGFSISEDQVKKYAYEKIKEKISETLKLPVSVSDMEGYVKTIDQLAQGKFKDVAKDKAKDGALALAGYLIGSTGVGVIQAGWSFAETSYSQNRDWIIKMRTNNYVNLYLIEMARMSTWEKSGVPPLNEVKDDYYRVIATQTTSTGGKGGGKFSEWDQAAVDGAYWNVIQPQALQLRKSQQKLVRAKENAKKARMKMEHLIMSARREYFDAYRSLKIAGYGEVGNDTIKRLLTDKDFQKEVKKYHEINSARRSANLSPLTKTKIDQLIEQGEDPKTWRNPDGELSESDWGEDIVEVMEKAEEKNVESVDFSKFESGIERLFRQFENEEIQGYQLRTSFVRILGSAEKYYFSVQKNIGNNDKEKDKKKFNSDKYKDFKDRAEGKKRRFDEKANSIVNGVKAIAAKVKDLSLETPMLPLYEKIDEETRAMPENRYSVTDKLNQKADSSRAIGLLNECKKYLKTLETLDEEYNRVYSRQIDLISEYEKKIGETFEEYVEAYMENESWCSYLGYQMDQFGDKRNVSLELQKEMDKKDHYVYDSFLVYRTTEFEWCVTLIETSIALNNNLQVVASNINKIHDSNPAENYVIKEQIRGYKPEELIKKYNAYLADVNYIIKQKRIDLRCSKVKKIMKKWEGDDIPEDPSLLKDDANTALNILARTRVGKLQEQIEKLTTLKASLGRIRSMLSGKYYYLNNNHEVGKDAQKKVDNEINMRKQIIARKGSYAKVHDAFNKQYVEFDRELKSYKAGFEKAKNSFEALYRTIKSKYNVTSQLKSFFETNHKKIQDIPQRVNGYYIECNPFKVYITDYEPEFREKWEFIRRVGDELERGTEFYVSEMPFEVPYDGIGYVDRDDFSGGTMKLTIEVPGADTNPMLALKEISYRVDNEKKTIKVPGKEQFEVSIPIRYGPRYYLDFEGINKRENRSRTDFRSVLIFTGQYRKNTIKNIIRKIEAGYRDENIFPFRDHFHPWELDFDVVYNAERNFERLDNINLYFGGYSFGNYTGSTIILEAKFTLTYYDVIAGLPGTVSGNTVLTFSRADGGWRIIDIQGDNPFTLISTGNPTGGMPSGYVTFTENVGIYFETQTFTDDSTGDMTGQGMWPGDPCSLYSFYGMAFAGNGSINSFTTCPDEGSFVTGVVECEKGDVWWVKTQSGKYAKIHIEDYFNGDYYTSWTKIYYIFNPSGEKDF